jgi:hypothetical protein
MHRVATRLANENASTSCMSVLVSASLSKSLSPSLSPCFSPSFSPPFSPPFLLTILFTTLLTTLLTTLSSHHPSFSSIFSPPFLLVTILPSFAITTEDLVALRNSEALREGDLENYLGPDSREICFSPSFSPSTPRWTSHPLTFLPMLFTIPISPSLASSLNTPRRLVYKRRQAQLEIMAFHHRRQFLQHPNRYFHRTLLLCNPSTLFNPPK